MTNIKHHLEPQQDSGTWDANQIGPAGLTLIGGDSYGDWTLYAVRNIQNAAGTVPNICNLRVTVGHKSIAVDANILPNVFLTAQSLQTWIVYHAVCSEIRCEISVETLAGARPPSDRVGAWIAPGRPSYMQIPQRMIAALPMIIPTFAVSLEFYHSVLITDVIEWYNVQGVLLHTTQLTTSAVAVPVQAKVPIVAGATHAIFVGFSPRLIWNVLA